MAKQTKAQKAARRALNEEIARQVAGTSKASSEDTLKLVRAVVIADRAAAAPEEKQGELFSVQDCAAHFDSTSFITGQTNFLMMLE